MANAEKPYTYRVIAPCHRDGLYFDPDVWRQSGKEGPLLHRTSEPQVSRALVPYDEATTKATELKRLEFAEVSRKKGIVESQDMSALSRTGEELKARCDKVLAALERLTAKK